MFIFLIHLVYYDKNEMKFMKIIDIFIFFLLKIIMIQIIIEIPFNVIKALYLKVNIINFNYLLYFSDFFIFIIQQN